MTAKTTRTIGAVVFAMAVSAHLMRLTRAIDAQSPGETEWRTRTPWGDSDLHGEWTTEGEYGVPFERPSAEEGFRAFDFQDQESAARDAVRRQAEARS